MGIIDEFNNYIGIIAAVATIISVLIGFGLSLSPTYILLTVVIVLLLFLVYKITLLNTRIYILFQSHKAISDSFYNTAKDYLENHLTPEEFISKLSSNIFAISKNAADTLLSLKYGSLSPQRVHELLEKYRNGTLDAAEAEELRSLLEEEKKQKERDGDIGSAILIGLILLAILAIINAASKRE